MKYVALAVHENESGTFDLFRMDERGQVEHGKFNPMYQTFFRWSFIEVPAVTPGPRTLAMGDHPAPGGTGQPIRGDAHHGTHDEAE